VSTGISLIPELWSNDQQQIINLTTKLRLQLENKYGDNIPSKNFLFQYQDELNELKNKVREIEGILRKNEEYYSLEMLIEMLEETNLPKAKKEDPSKMVFGFLDKYIRENELTRAKGSLVVYKSLKKHLNNYQKKPRI